VTDHHAIIPTGVSTKNLDEFEAKIFDMVARRFIAAFYPAAQFEITTRITRVEGEAFKSEGKVIVDPGWLSVYGKQAAGQDEQALCPVARGESAETQNMEIVESQTKPPARFTEGTLLSAMEGAGKLVDDEELHEAMSQRGLDTATRSGDQKGLLLVVTSTVVEISSHKVTFLINLLVARYSGAYLTWR
jgi:DNA topoisomerase-3